MRELAGRLSGHVSMPPQVYQEDTSWHLLVSAFASAAASTTASLLLPARSASCLAVRPPGAVRAHGLQPALSKASRTDLFCFSRLAATCRVVSPSHVAFRSCWTSSSVFTTSKGHVSAAMCSAGRFCSLPRPV